MTRLHYRRHGELRQVKAQGKAKACGDMIVEYRGVVYCEGIRERENVMDKL